MKRLTIYAAMMLIAIVAAAQEPPTEGIAESELDSQLQSVVEVVEADFPIGRGVVVQRFDDKPVADGHEGLMVTAFHVYDALADKTNIRTRYKNGRKGKLGSLWNSSAVHLDAAIIRVWLPPGVEPVKMAVEIKRGDVLIWTHRDGTVSKSTASGGTDVEMIFGDTYLRPGDSGGPVFNDRGELVGVISGGWFWFPDELGRKTTWPARGCGIVPIRKLLIRPVIVAPAEVPALLPTCHGPGCGIGRW